MKTLIINGSWLLKKEHYINFYVKNETTKEKVGGIYGFFDTLRKVILFVQPTKVVIAWNGFYEGKHKYDFYSPWLLKKQEVWQKKEMYVIRDGNFLAGNKEDEAFYDILRQEEIVKNICEDLYIRQIEEEYSESLDLVAYYTLIAKHEEESVYIMSKSHDFYQLIDENVHCLIQNKEGFEIITHENFTKKNGYKVDNSLLINCFCGDGRGFVDGVKNISRKKIIHFFPFLAEDKYFYSQICEFIISQKNFEKKKFYSSFLSSSDTLKRNSRVLNMDRPFINKSAKKEIEKSLWHPLSIDRDIKETRSEFEKIMIKTRININMEEFFSPFYRFSINEKEFNKQYNSF